MPLHFWRLHFADGAAMLDPDLCEFLVVAGGQSSLWAVSWRGGADAEFNSCSYSTLGETDCNRIVDLAGQSLTVVTYAVAHQDFQQAARMVSPSLSSLRAAAGLLRWRDTWHFIMKKRDCHCVFISSLHCLPSLCI